jgi:hypothetical protein
MPSPVVAYALAMAERGSAAELRRDERSAPVVGLGRRRVARAAMARGERGRTTERRWLHRGPPQEATLPSPLACRSMAGDVHRGGGLDNYLRAAWMEALGGGSRGRRRRRGEKDSGPATTLVVTGGRRSQDWRRRRRWGQAPVCPVWIWGRRDSRAWKR